MNAYRKSVIALFIATVLWGGSFILIKILDDFQAPVARSAGIEGEFLSSSQLVLRYVFALLLLTPIVWFSSGFRFLKTEIVLGVGCGVFSGMGMLLQTNGLQFTSASVSAFLTQAYCVILPLFELFFRKKLPSRKTLFCCGLLSVGILILSDISWTQFQLGRGEIETLCSAVMFACQIFWIDAKARKENNPLNATFIYFCTLISICLFVAFLFRPVDWGTVFALYADYRSLYSIALLGLFCTFVSFILMNMFQPNVPSTVAGLIYSMEPLVAGVLALFVPTWISLKWNLNYLNEIVTPKLIWGGGLMLAANIILQINFEKLNRRSKT
jgi:drug/metabolite transporter (DMT)-like permease